MVHRAQFSAFHPGSCRRRTPRQRAGQDTLGIALLREGLIGPEDLVHALSLKARRSGRLIDLLRARGTASEDAICSGRRRAAFRRLAGGPLRPPARPLADRPHRRAGLPATGPCALAAGGGGDHHRHVAARGFRSARARVLRRLLARF